MPCFKVVFVLFCLLFCGSVFAADPEPTQDPPPDSTHTNNTGNSSDPAPTPGPGKNEPTLGRPGDFPTHEQLKDAKTLQAAIDNTEGGARRLLERLQLSAGLGGEPIPADLLESLNAAVNQQTASELVDETLKDLPEGERDALAESLAQLLAGGEDVDLDAAIEALYGGIEQNPTTNVAELINGLPVDDAKKDELISRLGDRVARALELSPVPSDSIRGEGAQYDRDIIGREISNIARDSVIAEFSPLEASRTAANQRVQTASDKLALETSSAGLRAAREDFSGAELTPGLAKTFQSSEALAKRFEDWNIRWDTTRDARQFTATVDELVSNSPSREQQEVAWGNVVRSGGLENADKVARAIERGGDATLEDIPESFRAFKQNAVAEFEETLGLKKNPSGSPFSETQQVETTLALRDLRSEKPEVVSRGADTLARNVGLGNAKDTLTGIAASDDYKGDEVVSAVRGAFARKVIAEDGAVKNNPLLVANAPKTPLTDAQLVSHTDNLVDELRANRPEIFSGFKDGRELVAALGDRISSDGRDRVRASFDAARLNPLQLTDQFLAQHGKDSTADTVAVGSRFGRLRERIDQTFGSLPINDDEEGLLRIYAGVLRDFKNEDATQIARRGLQLFNALPGSGRAQATAQLRAIAGNQKLSSEDRALFGTLARVFESRLGQTTTPPKGSVSDFQKRVLGLATGTELVRENNRIAALQTLRSRLTNGERLTEADQATITQHGGRDRLDSWYFRHSPEVLRAGNQNVRLNVSVSRIARKQVTIGGRILGPGESATVEVSQNQFSQFRTSILGLPSRVSVSGLTRIERLTNLSEDQTEPVDTLQFKDGKFNRLQFGEEKKEKPSPVPRRRPPRGPVMYASDEKNNQLPYSLAGFLPDILMRGLPGGETRAFGRIPEKPLATEVDSPENEDILSVVRRAYEGNHY